MPVGAPPRRMLIPAGKVIGKKYLCRPMPPAIGCSARRAVERSPERIDLPECCRVRVLQGFANGRSVGDSLYKTAHEAVDHEPIMYGRGKVGEGVIHPAWNMVDRSGDSVTHIAVKSGFDDSRFIHTA